MLSAAARAAASYQRTAVQSESPLALVVMLYDGAIASVTRARDAAARHDLKARRDAVSQAMAIVNQLQSTLDMTAGGELAQSLDSLYTYLVGRMVDANIKKDPKALDEVHRLLCTLREGWQQIANTSPGAAPRTQP